MECQPLWLEVGQGASVIHQQHQHCSTCSQCSLLFKPFLIWETHVLRYQQSLCSSTEHWSFSEGTVLCLSSPLKVTPVWVYTKSPSGLLLSSHSVSFSPAAFSPHPFCSACVKVEQGARPRGGKGLRGQITARSKNRGKHIQIA